MFWETDISLLKKMSSTDRQQGYIVDPARRKSVKVGPEENVRQALINHLTDTLGIPLGLISVEKEILSSDTTIRADIVVYDRKGTPWMVVECKSPSVKISQQVFEQVARYNAHLRAPYLLVSNGKEHFAWEWESGSNEISFLPDLPTFPPQQ